MKIIVYKNKNGEYIGVDTIGHADAAEYGEDIYCAGVSALFINMVNSIEELTKDQFSYDSTGYGESDDKGNPEEDRISFRLTGEYSADAQLLLKSFVLGIKSIIKGNGSDYIELDIVEI